MTKEKKLRNYYTESVKTTLIQVLLVIFMDSNVLKSNECTYHIQMVNKVLYNSIVLKMT
jgi:hypothetical protein